MGFENWNDFKRLVESFHEHDQQDKKKKNKGLKEDLNVVDNDRGKYSEEELIKLIRADLGMTCDKTLENYSNCRSDDSEEEIEVYAEDIAGNKLSESSEDRVRDTGPGIVPDIRLEEN